VGVELRRADGGVIAVEVVGKADTSPVLFCHGLADSRLSAHSFAGAAHEFGLRLIAPDRPGIGDTNARRLNRVVDWVAEASLVLDALGVGSVALLGVSGGGAFAAACAAEMPQTLVDGHRKHAVFGRTVQPVLGDLDNVSADRRRAGGAGRVGGVQRNAQQADLATRTWRHSASHDPGVATRRRCPRVTDG